MLTRRRLLTTAALLAAGLSAGAWSQVAEAKQAAIFTGLVKGVAVGGYDPVAYFTAGRAMRGLPTLTTEHEGATWRFATAANRDLFLADPTRYAPQFGGYCAWAVANNYTAKGDPEAWTVHDGKLYLNYNESVRKNWAKDIPGNVRKGNSNWPKVLEKG